MALGFKGGVALTVLSRGVSVAIGLVSSVITARALGPDGRGLLATLSVITGLSLQFGNPGLHSGNVYFVSREPRRTSAVLGNTLIVSIAAGLVLGVLTAALGALRADWFRGVPYPLILLTAAVLPFQFMLLLYQNTLLGMKEIEAFNLFELGNKAATFVLLAVLLLGFGGGAPGAAVLFAVMAVVAGSVSAAYCFRKAPFRPVLDAALLREMLPYGARAYLACLLAFMVIRSDMLLVNYFLGPAATGVYSIAAQIADTLLLVPVTIGMILLPRVASERQEQRRAVTARVLRHTVLLMACLCAGAALLVVPVVRLLYGPRFEGAIGATWCLLPGVFALGLNGVLMNHFAAEGLPKVTTLAPLLGLVLNVALNLAVVPRFGIQGAAATSSGAYLLMLAVSLRAFLHDGGVRLRDSLLVGRDELKGLLREPGR
jgi:antigen flippase